MRITATVLLCLFLTLNLSASDEDEKIKKQFEEIWSRFVSEFDGLCRVSIDMLLAASQVKEFMNLGVRIVPYIAENLRCEEETSRTILRAMAVVATALLTDKSIREVARDPIPTISKKYGGFYGHTWLKWWEKEGKELYEKRIKEVGEKEKAKEKPEREKAQPETEPPVEPTPHNATPEPLIKPEIEPERKSEVIKPELPEPVKKPEAAPPQAVEERSIDWPALLMIIACVVLAGFVIVLRTYRFRRR